MSSVSSQPAIDLDIFEDLDLISVFETNTVEMRRAQMHEQCLKLASNGFENEALTLFMSINTSSDATRSLSTSISLLEIIESDSKDSQRIYLFKMAFGCCQVALSRYYYTTNSKYLIPEQIMRNAIVRSHHFTRDKVARFLTLAAFLGNFESVIRNLQMHEEQAKSSGVYNRFVAQLQSGTRRSSEQRYENEREVQMLLKERLYDQNDGGGIFEGD